MADRSHAVGFDRSTGSRRGVAPYVLNLISITSRVKREGFIPIVSSILHSEGVEKICLSENWESVFNELKFGVVLMMMGLVVTWDCKCLP